ncbi:hypothetical protein Tco_0371875 [Tanacetum coccineum]
MALADDELTVRKSHARNGEWVDITIRKVNTLLSMDEDADWQNYLKYINIDLKFVEEQRLNILSKYNKMVFKLNKCLEVDSIRRIPGLDMAYWGFLGVGTTFDIFQNIHILYLRYGVLSLSRYGILGFIPRWSLVSADTDTPYLP